MIVKCAWCAKVKQEDGSWAVQVIPEGETEVSHGICPPCRTKLRNLSR